MRKRSISHTPKKFCHQLRSSTFTRLLNRLKKFFYEGLKNFLALTVLIVVEAYYRLEKNLGSSPIIEDKSYFDKDSG
jgi:hypothetical protein